MKLQDIIFPSKEVLTEELSMYYRASNNFFYSDDEKCHVLLEKGAVRFNTYFNAFSLAKWKKYTHLNDLTLSLVLQGSFYIELRGLSLTKDGVHTSQPFVNRRYSFALW